MEIKENPKALLMGSSEILNSYSKQFLTYLTGSCTSAPVDIESIAREMGAKIEYETMLNDGTIEQLAPKKFIIRVNKKSNPNRQRFTIAHEVSHIILSLPERSKIRLLIEKSLTQEGFTINKLDEERTCNIIAAFLLVPFPVAKQLANWDNFSIKRIERAAKIWKVSLEVLLRRVLSLMPYEGGFAWYKPDQDNHSLHLKGGEFPKSNKIYFPSQIWLYAPDSSPIDIPEKDERFFMSKLEFDVTSYRLMRAKAFGKNNHKRVLIVSYPQECLFEKSHHIKGEKQTILLGKAPSSMSQ